MSAGALFVRYGAELLTLARRITGSAADAEEVVGDVFLALVEGKAPEAGRAYLRRAVTNRSLNVLRRRRRHARPVPGETLDARPDPCAAAEHLRDGIAQLPKRQAEVFALRHLHGLDTGEIAEALDIARATVRVHLHQAARTLRTLFDPKEAKHA